MEFSNSDDVDTVCAVFFNRTDDLYCGAAEGVRMKKKGMEIGFRTLALALFFIISLVVLLTALYGRITPAAERGSWQTACESLVSAYAKTPVKGLVDIGGQCAPLDFTIEGEGEVAKKQIANLLVDCQQAYTANGKINYQVFDNGKINCLPCFTVTAKKEITDLDSYLTKEGYAGKLSVKMTSKAQEKTKTAKLLNYQSYANPILAKEKYLVTYIEANEDSESASKVILIKREDKGVICENEPFGKLV